MTDNPAPSPAKEDRCCFAYVLDHPAEAGVGGIYMPGVGLVLALSSDREGLESLRPQLESAARTVNRPLKLVSFLGNEIVGMETHPFE